MAIARLAGVSLDSDDPIGLGRFYRALLDLRLLHESDDVVVLGAKGVALTVERVAEHKPPDWPNDAVPKQMHLDLYVDDLDVAEAEALAIGARKPETQPAPDKWRVLLDPSGHPFCLTLPA
ncbi:VOC family protein [Nocardia takedensis]|uniref:VOC family protein n=1 Tax=Nocardia takedensis TaxID=259390 RepID=UPI00030681EA|nr:VOC family protein [Nocardia takedensis]